MVTDKKTVATSTLLETQIFFLESEIRLSRMGVWSTVFGLCVLLILKMLLPATQKNSPSLAALMVIGIAVTGFYLGIRYLAFGVIRYNVRQKYPIKNPRIRSIQGEIPRNWFLAGLLIPSFALIPLCFSLLILGIGLGPEMWIVISVGSALALGDLISVGHVLFVDPARWIKETPLGLDVLKPVREF